MTTSTSTTLIGYLGKNREIRTTRERTSWTTVHNQVIDGEEEIEVRIPAREYMKLSLATHERTASGVETRWHDLIFWNPDRVAYMARKGDQVKVTGRREEYSFETESGEPRKGVHFVVETFRILRRKVRVETA